MNFHKPSNKFFIFFVTCVILLANDIHAADLETIKQECAELGFKIKTPVNGKCVLKLMKKIRGSTDSNAYNSIPLSQQQLIEAAQQRTYERQQRYAKDAEIEQKEREIAALRQQQEQQAQWQARQQQGPSGASALLYILSAGVQGYNQGLQQSRYFQQIPFQPIQNRSPINCKSKISSYSNTVNTTCTQY